MRVTVIVLILCSPDFLEAVGSSDDKQTEIEFLREPETPPFQPLYVQINSSGEKDYDFIENLPSLTNESQFQEQIKELLESSHYLCPLDETHLAEGSTTKARMVFLPHLLSINHRYCLFEKKFQPGKKIKCNKEVEPLIIKEENYSCYSKMSEEEIRQGTLYSFIFMACDVKVANIQQPKLQYSKLYSFCYNEGDGEIGEVLYTRHRIWKPLLLKHINALGDLANYRSTTFSAEGYSIFILQEFEKIANKYNDARRLGLAYHASVPAKDFAFGHWKKTTYHYANVKPAEKKSIAVWGIIEKRIRNKAIELNVELEINMGLFLIPAEEGEEYVWIKVVLDESSQPKTGIAIMVFDNDEPLDSSLCNKQQCFTESGKSRMPRLRCCSVTNELTNLFGFSVEDEEYLNMVL